MSHRSESRPRSRSPEDHQHSERSNYRQRSPHQQDHDYHARHRRYRKHANQPNAKELPLGARPISKHDLLQYRPMFTLYLDVQKRLDIEDLSEDEVKGRWKSFVGKWNRGELAEGWYDPKTFHKALHENQTESMAQTTDEAVTYPNSNHHQYRTSQKYQNNNHKRSGEDDGSDNEEDDFGPAMPYDLTNNSTTNPNTIHSGPSIPTLQDIRARDEQIAETAYISRKQGQQETRFERKADRRIQQERLDDLVPRPDAGRDRALEKKKVMSDSKRAYADAQGGGDIELKDSDVMGDDGMSELKKMQKEQERKKNEREVRREEILRARIAEREEQMQKLREKENKTMDMLKRIAQARFGGGSTNAAETGGQDTSDQG